MKEIASFIISNSFVRFEVKVFKHDSLIRMAGLYLSSYEYLFLKDLCAKKGMAFHKKKLEGCCKSIDDIVVPNYGFFIILINKIYTGEPTAIQNGNNIKKQHVNYLDVNVIVMYNDKKYIDD